LWKETKYGPLASAMDSLRYIDQMLRDSADYSAMQNYMQKLMQKGLYQKTKWINSWSDINDAADLQAENDPERTYDKVMANNIIIENACYYETSSCLQDASDKFDQWKDSGVDFTDKFDS
jgi:ERAP1-like C-terminal domain